jgi:hypothetical protein
MASSNSLFDEEVSNNSIFSIGSDKENAIPISQKKAANL